MGSAISYFLFHTHCTSQGTGIPCTNAEELVVAAVVVVVVVVVVVAVVVVIKKCVY